MIIESKESEIGVLGACMLGEQGRSLKGELPIDVALNRGCERRWFNTPAHAHLWEVMSDMHTSGSPVDLLTVGERAREMGRLDSLGGYEFLDELVDSTPTAAHLEYYLDHAERHYKLREIDNCCQEASDKAREGTAEPLSVITGVTGRLDALSSPAERETVDDMMDDNITVLDNAQKGIVSGLPFPWPKFTEQTGGMQISSVIPFVGRDGKGKSGAVAQIADHWVGLDIPTLIFSLEDVPRRTLLRMAGCRMWFSARDFEQGSTMCNGRRQKLCPEEFNDLKQKVRKYQEWLHDKPFEIVDGSFTGDGIAREMKAFRRRHGIKDGAPIGTIVDGYKDIDHSEGDTQTSKENYTSKALFRAAKECWAAMPVVSHITKIDDNIPIVKENIKGSGTQFQGARQAVLFQDAGLPQIIEDGIDFVISVTKSNFGSGGSIRLRRDEKVLEYRELSSS